MRINVARPTGHIKGEYKKKKKYPELKELHG
jgi:hypothetical protein